MLYRLLKRLIDLFSSIVLIFLFLPVWIIVPILIKLDSEGPVIFFQPRVGKNGVVFKIIKFRTMKHLADDYWKQNPELYLKYKTLGWKLPLNEDPRITRLGKLLRQTSIDEFPQLFNILFGTMSLVGPRPIREIEIKDAVKRYGKDIKKVINQSLTVKPGLTGPWQVSGRNDIPWDKRVSIDARYASRRNIFDDFIVICRTPLAMISKW